MTSFDQRRVGTGELATLGEKWYNQPQISKDPVASHAAGVRHLVT
jgi:hypothetical protein